MSLQTAIDELTEAEVQVRSAAQSLYGTRTAALAHTATDIAQELDALRRQVEEKAGITDDGEGDTPNAQEAAAADGRG